MKKKFLSLILLPLVLSSCNSGSLSFEAMKEKVDAIADDHKTPMYVVSGSIDFNGKYMNVYETFDKEPDIAGQQFVPYSKFNEGFYLPDLDIIPEVDVMIFSMASRSYWLRAPLRITEDNFYGEYDNKENITCAHYILNHLITSYIGQTGSTNPSKNQMKMTVTGDGHYIFSGSAVHTKILVDNYPYYPDYASHPELGEWDPDIDPLPCYKNTVNAKVNISFEYDANGWLIKEEMSSVGYNFSVNSDAQIALRAQYTYIGL